VLADFWGEGCLDCEILNTLQRVGGGGTSTQEPQLFYKYTFRPFQQLDQGRGKGDN